MTFGVTFTSCIDDQTTVEEDRDLYIGSIQLGNLKRINRYINSKGNDTTSIVTVIGSQFGLTIDQTPDANGVCHIYNVDSLPHNTLMDKVAFRSIQAYNGVVTIDRVIPTETETDTIFSPTDSTDFTRKRYFTLYGRDQVSRRKYEIELRVHQEYGDSLRWQLQGISDEVAAMTRTKALFAQGAWYLFGTKGDARYVLTANGSQPLDTDIDTRSITVYDGKFYGLAGATLMASVDGRAWHRVDGAPQMRSLFGTWSQGLVAYTAVGKVVRATGNAAWVEDEAEAEYPMPDTEVMAVAKMKTNGAPLEDIILVGQRDGSTHIWKSTLEHRQDGTVRSYGWKYLPQTSENTYPCPMLRQPALVNYDGGALLIGTGMAADTINNPLYSEDYGRTWIRHPYMNFKMAFGTNVLPHPAATPAVAVAVSEDQYVWVFCQQTGEIWRGRINRLGWRKEQTTFDKTRRR